MNIIGVMIDPEGENMESIHVTLSRRNLETLLKKLDDPTSAKVLYCKTDHGVLIVTAQENDQHYRDRIPGVVKEDLQS